MKRIFTFLLLSIHFIGAAQTVTFEELTLAPDTFWDGADLSAAGFESGGLYFPTYYNSEFSYWEGGVAYSNVTDSITSGYGNLYASKAGKGANNSSNYAVAYGSGYFKSATSNGFPTNTLNLFISNGTYAYNSMRDGDGFAKKFGGETGNDPDYFYVVFKGYRAGIPSSTDSVVHYLADFRFEDNSQDYIQLDWEEINLNPLATFDSVVYTFASSDVGGFGINTPLQFCMDHISYESYINSVNSPVDAGEITVYPNPSNGMITIDLPKEKNGTLDIVDAAGRAVISDISINDAMQINIENLTNGVYFVRLTSPSNIYNNKFILSK